jgi:hypothetical protein
LGGVFPPRGKEITSLKTCAKRRTSYIIVIVNCTVLTHRPLRRCSISKGGPSGEKINTMALSFTILYGRALILWQVTNDSWWMATV